MGFFADNTTINIIGIILLVLGAVMTFFDKKIARAAKTDSAQISLAIKLVGLVLVVIAFIVLLNA